MSTPTPAPLCETGNFFSFLNERNIYVLAIASACGISTVAIANSLGNDVAIPLASFAIQKDITSAHITLKKGSKAPYNSYNACKEDPDAIVLCYGKFISTILNLFITLLLIFLLIKTFCMGQKTAIGLGNNLVQNVKSISTG